MKVLFLSNYLSHHQKPLSDELYNILGDGNYYFICTDEISIERINMGWKDCYAPYVMNYKTSERGKIDKMIIDFDVVIYGDAPLSIIKKRYLLGKLTFCNSERRYKTLSRYLKYPFNTFKSYYINKGYFLSSSGFATKDFILSGMPLKKCFKWGYFPEVKKYNSIEKIIESKNKGKTSERFISILWAGRFIEWKHPEIALKLAAKLKRKEYDFILNVIGNGKLENKLKSYVEKNSLKEYVHFLGSKKPSEVRAYMEQADIFLFTSDRHEGWGVVLNESMNSACAVVANDAIGSVPYMIKHGINGFKYKDGRISDLYRKVICLIEDPEKRIEMQKNAYQTIIEKWEPTKAANNLLFLIDSLLRGECSSIEDGPGSQAPLLFDKWIL